MAKLISKQQVNDLQRMKLIASLLLVFFAILFFIANYFESRYSCMPYIRAFAEASLVGGLADWFAVVALFKHPLSIPIPHTNLIEKKKESIAANLAAFIYNNFLAKDKLRDKLHTASKDLTQYIRQSNESDLFNKLINYYPKKFELEDEDLKKFITQQANAFFQNIDLSDFTAKVLNVLTKNGEHQKLLNEILKQLNEIITNKENIDFVYTKVKDASRFAIGTENYTKGLFAFLEELIDDIHQNPEHDIRQKFNDKIKVYMVDLTHQKYQVRFVEIKESILQSSSYKSFIDSLWINIKEKILLYIKQQKNDHILAGDLSNFINKQFQDEYVNFIFESWIVDNLTKLIENKKDEIEHYVKDTVMSWPNTSLMLEQYLGKDLQYIRINGSLVGGIIGLIIHLLS